MGSEWMGRYRPLVAALVQHVNIVSRQISKRRPDAEGRSLSMHEWQVLEYIIEHADDDSRMTLVSRRLGIPQSSFSVIAQRLSSLGLVERYREVGNKKNVILKPSEEGIAYYQAKSLASNVPMFQPFFDSLEEFDTETIERFAACLEVFNSSLLRREEYKPPKQMIRIE